MRRTDLRAAAIAIVALLIVAVALLAGRAGDVAGAPAVEPAQDLRTSDDLAGYAFDDWQSGFTGAAHLIEPGRLELPRARDLVIRGWAFDPDVPPPDATVLGIVDERDYEHVASALPRPDVAAAKGDAAAAASGYEAPLDTSTLAAGVHTFRIAIVSRSSGVVHRSARPLTFVVR